MKKYFYNNNSDTLIIFFTGWGCDEYEFGHLGSDSDVLLLFDYADLNLDFDFSKYKHFNLLAFSAGVFVASIYDFDFKIDKKVALSGNPYLFDERLGLSSKIQTVLQNITEESADDFARNYLVKTDAEWQKFHHSKRTIESCRMEFNSLKQIYCENKHIIRDIYDFAFIGEEDKIFDVSEQKKFYETRLQIVKNARHSLFFRIDKYEEIFNHIV